MGVHLIMTLGYCIRFLTIIIQVIGEKNWPLVSLNTCFGHNHKCVGNYRPLLGKLEGK